MQECCLRSTRVSQKLVRQISQASQTTFDHCFSQNWTTWKSVNFKMLPNLNGTLKGTSFHTLDKAKKLFDIPHHCSNIHCVAFFLSSTFIYCKYYGCIYLDHKAHIPGSATVQTPLRSESARTPSLCWSAW